MNKKVFTYSYEMKKERNYNVGLNILFCIVVFVVINLLFSYLVFPVKQASHSMNPDVDTKSLIMFSKIRNNFQRGDLILVKQKSEKGESLLSKLSEKTILFFTGQQVSHYEMKNYPGTKQQIRRIVAVPGDTFYMRDYVLYIKPAGEKHFLTEFEITKKTYNVSFVMPPSGWDSYVGVPGVFEETTLGPDEYFVLSDFRLSSDDSRIYGSVKKEDIDGKALFCYFPFNKIKFY